MRLKTRKEAVILTKEIKRAIKSIDRIIRTQYYLDHKNLIDLKFKLTKRLEEIEELIALGELPESTINEWAEATDAQLKLLGIKKIIL